jgi:hypothetical protein
MVDIEISSFWGNGLGTPVVISRASVPKKRNSFHRDVEVGAVWPESKP